MYCPRASDTTCCKVTLHLQCVDFSAYTSLYRPLRDVIWTRLVCDAATRKSAKRHTLVPVADKKHVKTFGNVYMFGASHMRFKYDYLIEECYERPANLSQKHSSTSVGNLHYRWCTYADQFDRIFSSEGTLKRNDLVLLQTGAHDLARRGMAASMGASIRRFVETLAVFSESSKRRGFKLVLLTSPPCSVTVKADGTASPWPPSPRC